MCEDYIIDAVSYTHLDVYKRQPSAYLAQRSLKLLISDEGSSFPVSYTHLDVYKRQHVYIFSQY